MNYFVIILIVIFLLYFFMSDSFKDESACKNIKAGVCNSALCNIDGYNCKPQKISSDPGKCVCVDRN